MEDSFLNHIITADKCALKEYTADDFAKTDKQLNTIYSKIMNAKEYNNGTVTKESIKTTQRQWIKYRDAWVEFGKIHCPKISDNAWKTMITYERIEQLNELSGGIGE